MSDPKPSSRFIQLFTLILVVAALLSSRGPSARADADADAKAAALAKWESAIVFYTQEDIRQFSIRILDSSVTKPANFTYLSLWRYDPAQKKWLKIDDRQQTARIIMPKDKPEDAPPGSQLLADIPVTQDDVGIYYCKWQVDGLDGATYERLGPGHIGKRPDLGKQPEGTIVADVPIDKNHAEVQYVPDPATHTGEAGSDSKK